ncbi:MAG: fibronectin type III domain-containing protein [Gemmatimonadetes bacterium]|nr:fibronectin type III domain-containing protein [Gemmatimonadota bacterium]
MGRRPHGKAVANVEEWARGQIRYAESLYRKDRNRLRMIGWGGRRSPSAVPDTLPGQVANLVIQHEGKNSVSLSWRDPVEGGEVAAYKIQRRKTGADWADVGTAVTSEATVNNQEAGVEFEYQVIAVNKSGDGPASNIVRVVL